MIKCPYCPSVKFDIGKIKVGNNGSVDVIYCSKCESIIGVLEKTLNKPYDTESKSSVTTVPLRY
jgi:transcription elongation factor Elf1